MMTQEQILAYNLYRVRVLLKVSRPVLAQRLGIPKATIKNYETGLRRVPTSYLIAIIGLCTTEQRDCIINEVMIP